MAKDQGKSVPMPPVPDDPALADAPKADGPEGVSAADPAPKAAEPTPAPAEAKTKVKGDGVHRFVARRHPRLRVETPGRLRIRFTPWRVRYNTPSGIEDFLEGRYETQDAAIAAQLEAAISTAREGDPLRDVHKVDAFQDEYRY